ncbi:hypothetical protein FQN54_007769 [Arachnomyces sp. PD_36]|nr:hypothetical protein FQN54_007769 [Arachnomyces sp. PD_36]
MSSETGRDSETQPELPEKLSNLALETSSEIEDSKNEKNPKLPSVTVSSNHSPIIELELIKCDQYLHNPVIRKEAEILDSDSLENAVCALWNAILTTVFPSTDGFITYLEVWPPGKWGTEKESEGGPGFAYEFRGFKYYGYEETRELNFTVQCRPVKCEDCDEIWEYELSRAGTYFYTVYGANEDGMLRSNLYGIIVLGTQVRFCWYNVDDGYCYWLKLPGGTKEAGHILHDAPEIQKGLNNILADIKPYFFEKLSA